MSLWLGIAEAATRVASLILETLGKKSEPKLVEPPPRSHEREFIVNIEEYKKRRFGREK